MTEAKTTTSRESRLFENLAGTGSGKRIEYFDYHAMPDQEIADAEQYCEYPESVPAAVDLHAFHAGTCKVQTLYADPENDGLSLGVYSFPPNFTLPRHWHDCDQIVFVLEGSMSTGNKQLRPGEGYYTRAGATYSFKAGPRGVRFMEFRPVTNFRTVFVEETPERWARTDLGAAAAAGAADA